MGEQQHVTQEIGGFVGKTEFHLLFASALAAPTPRQPVPGLRDLTNLLLKLASLGQNASRSSRFRPPQGKRRG